MFQSPGTDSLFNTLLPFYTMPLTPSTFTKSGEVERQHRRRIVGPRRGIGEIRAFSTDIVYVN